MSHADWDSRPYFDVSRYAPDSFDDYEESNAHAAGYPNAREKWIADMRWEWDKYVHDGHKRRVDAQVRMDLEAAGTPWDKIGALGDAVNGVLRGANYSPPTEFIPPKDELIREAASQGVVNRAVRLFEEMKRRGHEWDVESGESLTDDAQWATHYEREAREIEARLDAYGGPSFHDVAVQWENDDIEYQDSFDGEPEPDNPELKRIFDRFDEDVKAWHREHETTDTASSDHVSDSGWVDFDGGEFADAWRDESNDDDEGGFGDEG